MTDAKEPLSAEIMEKAVNILDSSLPKDFKEYANKILSSGLYDDEWMDFTIKYGADIRNILRANGIIDEMLPGGKWDYHYLDCLKAAVSETSETSDT